MEQVKREAKRLQESIRSLYARLIREKKAAHERHVWDMEIVAATRRECQFLRRNVTFDGIDTDSDCIMLRKFMRQRALSRTARLL